MAIRVTVCIPTHNRANFLGRSIRSLLNQTFSKNKFEILVVDDCSTDRSDLILKTFKNDIRIIKNEIHEGLSKSLNKAILASKGKYFLRIDSDDYVSEDYLKFLYTTLDANKDDFDAVKCDYDLVDDKEVFIKRCNSEKKPIGCGIIFKVDDLIKVGMYSEKKKIFEEIDLIQRLKNTKKFKIFRLPIPLYRYRMHTDNITKNTKK